MSEQSLHPVKPTIDLRAFWIAAFTGGIAALLASVLLSQIILSEPGFLLRLSASIVMGPEVVPVTEGNPAAIWIVGILVHFILSAAFALLVVLVVHRWGLIVGLLGGVLVGLAIYAINVYSISYFFPWIYPLRSWMLLAVHLVLGGFVGVVYELLDQYDLPFHQIPIEEVQ